MCRVLVNREIERNAVQECVERLLFLFCHLVEHTEQEAHSRAIDSGYTWLNRLLYLPSSFEEDVAAAAPPPGDSVVRGPRSRTHRPHPRAGPTRQPPLVCCAMHNTQPSYRRTRTTYHQRLKTGANSLLF